jgi:zinc transport system ATP-binding protein
VNFSINSGDYLCIVGANGSGKTTIVKATLGLLPLNKGKISKSQWKIGYLPQQSSIQRDFPASVWEVVLSGCIKKNLFYSKEDKKMADMQIEKLGLSGIAKKSYRDLSGGQQQRVLLARALCAGKDLLVLDEPVTGLDPVVTDELYSTIRELNQKEKIAVIMVSHDVNRAVQNATHILHMDRKPLFFGTSADYEKTELYKTMTNVEVCETHLCHHCGTGCHASHV